MIAGGVIRRADRNNKAFIRSLLAMPLIPINLVLSSWVLALAGLSWGPGALFVSLSLPLGLTAHRQLRTARSRCALRTLRDQIVLQGAIDA